MPSIINVSNNTITSINGQIGDVNLNAEDVNALPNSTFIPTKTSDLENDTDFVSDKNYVHTDNNYTTEEKSAVGTIKDKVDKIDGMGLSANNLTNELKEKYDDAVEKSHIHTNKNVLDATTASYTINEKNKLKNIEDNAQKNVQSDWNETDLSSDNFIKNKPKIPLKTSDLENDSFYVADANYVHTDNNYTDTDKSLVSDIPSKVEKVDGKGLSTNDLTDEMKQSYDDTVEKSHTHANKTILDGTTASYTTEDKNKLSQIESDLSNEITRAKKEEETISSNLSTHTSDISNPHKVTKAQVGLSNVDNTADSAKPISTAQATAIADAKKAGMDAQTNLTSHINNTSNPHKVTKNQLGLGNVENKTSATIRSEITKDNVTTALGYTPYTPNEVDNKISALETNIDWKESVDTYNDIATTYPNPDDGWTVNVKDTDYTYRYNGKEWVAISANAIPKATNTVDGLLSKEDHTKYEDANNKKHVHDNKSVLDGITSALVTAWNSAVAHISDTVKHITSEERTLWNTVSNKVDKVTGKGLSTNDYTTDEKNKLSGIADGANKTTVDSALSSTSTNPVQNKVVNDALNGKANSSHTHDDRYYTESEIDTKLSGKVDNTADGLSNVINKLVTATGIPEDNDYYVSQYAGGGTTYTTYHRRTMSALWSYIKSKADSVYSVLGHTHTKSEITDFPTSLPASDVASWAKQPNKPTYTKDEIGLGNVGNFKAVSTVASQGLTDTEKANARSNIGAGTSSFSGSYNDLSNKPTIPSAVAVKGDAETTYRTGNVNLTPANIGAVSQTKFDNLSIGGRNYLRNSNFLYSTDKNGTTYTIKYSVDANSVNVDEVFNNKIATFSFFINSPGGRKYLNTGAFINRFGMHGAFVWEKTATGERLNKYSFIMLDITESNKRVSMTEKITTPQEGYDKLLRIVFVLQCYTIPDDNNDAIWKIGYPKFELGNKPTDWTPAPEDLVEESKDYTDTKVADYLPLSGGTVNGQLTWNGEAALPAFSSSPTYLLGIESFATGGTTKYSRADKIVVGEASKVNGHTVNADVPSGAKFTDTNTWRGIQDNLTSTSIIDSLSANQGKVLKGLIDGKVGSDHTHTNLDSIGNVGYYGSDSANTNGWYKVYSTTLTGYGDHVARLSIISGYATIANGIINLHLRCDNSSTISVKRLSWENRQGFSVGDVIINTNGNTWTLYVKQSNSQYGRIKVRVLESLATSSNWNMTLTSNTTKESSDPTATVTATDGAIVNYANNAGSVSWGNISNKPSTYNPSTHTHSKSQITDFPTSMPASDVYAWAKATSKPSYKWSEIDDKPSIPTETISSTEPTGLSTGNYWLKRLN